MKVVKFGTHWVDGVLIASAIIGLFEAMWLMADIMPFGAKLSMLIAVVSLVCLSARDILSRMAVFELRTAVDPDKGNYEPGSEWDITPEEDAALDEFVDQYLDESVNEFWYKAMYSRPSFEHPKPMKGLKCEYAEGWWKNGRDNVTRSVSTGGNRVHSRQV